MAADVTLASAAVDGHAVAGACAVVKRQPALGRLLYEKILVGGEPCRSRYTGRQQCKSKIVAAVNRQIANVCLSDRVGLVRLVDFDNRRLRGYFYRLRYLRHFQAKTENHALPDVDHHVLQNLSLKTGNLGAHVISGWRQAADLKLALTV